MQSEPTAWRSDAPLANLRLAAEVNRQVRAFMDERGVLEVRTPVLSMAGATDPALESVVATGPVPRYLHTSPEFPMKRLIAQHGVDLYQIAAVFRADEIGRWHQPEFAMLEWYRVGFDHHRLMDEVATLVGQLHVHHGRAWREPERFAFGELVRDFTGQWPEALTPDGIEALFREADRDWPAGLDTLDIALDLLFDTFIVPRLAERSPCFVVDWPASRASLARTATVDGRRVAERFELFVDGVELANGFHELTDAAEQRRRFELDCDARTRNGQAAVPIDERLLAALEHGLPDCAGVALGLERLVMCLAGETSLEPVVAFTSERA